MPSKLDVNEAVDAHHDAAANLQKLNAATTDIRQELTYKYLDLERQDQYLSK